MAAIGKVIEGLEILSKYCPDGRKSHSIGAEHDTIHAGPAGPEESFSSADRDRLVELGWYFDESCERWARFV